ncbi:MAG: type II 3-dehydroquinate dehydratase [Bacteroidales bacterium]|nr:type II 3-dehydroquinate dehydratase [Bacteroidales bacterium]
MKIIIINGPNLNLLGKREKSIYGEKSFEEYFKQLKKKYKNISIEYFQSNVEGEIINKIHETGFSYCGIILNAGGYTHTSVAIADAIASVTTPVIEVHISNIYAREEYRKKSLISSKCKGVITGFGLDSYRLAVEYFVQNKN